MVYTEFDWEMRIPITFSDATGSVRMWAGDEAARTLVGCEVYLGMHQVKEDERILDESCCFRRKLGPKKKGCCNFKITFAFVTGTRAYPEVNE
jgi:hypothetical protein